MAKEKVLITGGAGYIGSVLTKRLLDGGYKATCLDNFMYRRREMPEFCNDSNFTFILGDARAKSILEDIIPINSVCKINYNNLIILVNP